MSMDFIPVELTRQILSMLPARSVLRCRSVCKTWRNLVDEPGFAALHFDRELQNQSHRCNSKQTRFFLRPVIGHYLSMYLVEQQQDSHMFNCTKMSLCLPESASSIIPHSLTAVNGLMSFSHSDYRGLHTFICNPFTGQFVMLPDLPSPSITIGFGYDISNMVFKAVHVSVSSPTEAHVYTILGSSSSWKKLDNAPSIKCGGSAVVANGHIHWRSDIESLMLSFDLSSETFGFISLPNLGSSVRRPSSIQNFDGCLSILVDVDDNHFELWIMKDYGVTESWTKVVVSLKRGFLGSIPISFWKEGEILLVYGLRTLVSYNVESGRYTPLEVIGLPHCQYCIVFPYCGNLLSLQPAS